MVRLALLSLLFCFPTMGQSLEDIPKSITLTWDKPVAREDGTVLTFQEIAGYQIEAKLDSESDPYLVRDVPGLENEEDGPLYILGGSALIRIGRNCFRIKAIDTNDLESQWSQEVCADIAVPDEYELIIDVRMGE
jgi:hypothetical protein